MVVRIEALLVLLGVSGAGCGPAVEADGGDPPLQAWSEDCEVEANDMLAAEAVVGWAFDVAVGPDGEPHVVWSRDGVLQAFVRDDAGRWEDVTGPLAAVDVGGDVDAEGSVHAGPVLLLRNAEYKTTTAWRWDGAAWQPVLEMQSNLGGNQSQAPLAVGGDGRAHFSLIEDPLDEYVLALHELPVDASRSRSLGALDIDGRDPLLGADARGDLHLMFAGLDTSQRALVYRDPDGHETRVLDDHGGWPDFAVAPDGLFAVAEVADAPMLLASEAGRAWVSHPIGEPRSDACPEYDDTSHTDAHREGEVCDQFSVHYSRPTLIGGPRAVLVVEEIREEGRKTWHCSYEHGGQCSWERAEDFEETHRLLIGHATLDGVELQPVPVPLRDDLHPTWTFRADQAGDGRVHVVLNETRMRDDGTTETIADFHHVELDCDDG